MELFKLLTLLTLLVFFSCSKSQDSKDASEGDDIEMVDGEEDDTDEDVEVVDSEDDLDEEEELADEDFEDEELDDEEELAEDLGGDEVEELQAAEEESVVDTGNEFESVDGAPLAATDSSMPTETMEDNSVNIADAGPTETYSVQPNETLMLIAFKLYGDYTRWKEIQRLNNDKLSGSTVVSPGMQLRYSSQGAGFVWNPSGNPYLIQRGDTLGVISNKVYNTTSKWRDIWSNNKALIRDPNKIYAGFTIYYIPQEGRDLASGAEAEPVSAQPGPGPEAEQQRAMEEQTDDFEDFPEDL